MDIRKEKWKSAQSLRSSGKYTILVYYKIVAKENFRKQWLLFLSVIHFEKTIYLRKHESITEFR